MAALHIFQCACAKLPYFYFRSEIWRHQGVYRPRFPVWSENSGDLRIFKAEIGIISPEWQIGGKIGEGWCDVDPQRIHSYFAGCYAFVPVLAKIDQEMRPWKCGQTDRQTDTRTYRDKLNLQSALCYAIAMGQIITLIYCRISEIPTSYRKSRSRNTMVTSDFRSEVEIRQFRARAL